MMDVFYIEFQKRDEMKSESNSESVNISQTAKETSAEPNVIIQSIKEKNEEVSETEDITVANNDFMDKLETNKLVRKASESIAQVESKKSKTVSKADEVTPEVKTEVGMSEVSVPVVFSSISTHQNSTDLN